MEPYSIRCTTCRAKLKVRKPEAIGQIVSCPRCGSMVMIHPKGPESGADTDQRELETGSVEPSRTRRGVRAPHARSMESESYELIHSLLDEESESQHDTQGKAAAITATLAARSRANRANPSHADTAMANSRSMSGLRIFGRATLMVIAMGVGAAIAVASFYLSKRTSIENMAPVMEADALPGEVVDPTIEVGEPSVQVFDHQPALVDLPIHRPMVEQAVALELVPNSERPMEAIAERERQANELPANFVDSKKSPVPWAMRTVRKPSLPESTAPISTVGKPPPREIDIAARLADPIGRLSLPQIGLKDLSRLISSMSTVPISFDRSAFAFGASPSSSVTVAANDDVVLDVVRNAIERLKLTARTDGDHLIIEHVSASRTKRKNVGHSVSDLVANANELKQLTSFARRFVEPNGGSVAAGTGVDSGKLVVQDNHAGHLRLGLLLDQIRTARGIEFQPRFASELASIAPRWQAADSLLDRRITVRHKNATRLDQLLIEIEERTGLHILVDWHALDPEGWNEWTMVTSNRWQEPARDVLEDIVAQIGATCRIVMSNTVSITSVEEERTTMEVAFFPIDDLLDDGQTLSHIMEMTKQSIGAASFHDHGGSGFIGFDAPSQMLVIRLPQSDLRAVDQIMSNWRSL